MRGEGATLVRYPSSLISHPSSTTVGRRSASSLVPPNQLTTMKNVRYSTSLTFEGYCFLIVAGFILAGALTRQINLLMVLFGLLAGAFFAHWVLVKRTLRKITLERRLPKSIPAGELLVVELTATNHRRRLGAWAVAATDSLRRESSSRSGRAIRPRTLFSHVPANAVSTTTYRGRIAQRGRYRFGPLQISSRFPFGFLRCRATFDLGGMLLVYPRLGRLTPAWRRWQEGLESGAGRSSPRQGLLEGDFYGLRDWRSGDSRRWLHWRTSARRQTPVVRQFEQQRDRGLAVLADLWQPDQAEQNELDAVEIATSLAATIATDLCRAGGRKLSLAVTGTRPWLVEGPASAALLEELMEQLATSEASSVDHLPESLAELLNRIRRSTLVIFVSTRPLDVASDPRFDLIRNDSRHKRWLSRLKTVDTSSNSFSELFQVA
jgi:uncharacterized protein (DUF58 family)